VLVTIVVWLPLMILMASFVVDVANWFVHKRHLQMQADAAALAAARDWVQPGCDWSRIDARARSYGGGTWNAQIGGTLADNVHLRLNSTTYYNQDTPVDTTVGPPNCDASMVDVKLTETDLPWFLKAARLVPFINARARVSIFEADTVTGALPVGVPDPRPERARAIFVDETTGAVIAQRDLTRAGGLDSPYWDNAGAPLPITVNQARIGVRIALTTRTSGPYACGDALVECFDAGSGNGLLHIRGWSAAGTVTTADNPIARDVRMVPGTTCTGVYFSSSASQCLAGIDAKIDFGTLDPVGAVAARVSANIGGAQSYTMTYDPVTQRWSTAVQIPIASGAGPVPVNIHWEKRSGTSAGLTCTNGNNTPCKGDFLGAQRVFSAAAARSGAVKKLRVFDVTAPAVDANSIERCATCTHDLVVEMELLPSLRNAASTSDPPVVLRFTGGGSLTQALDCDPAKNRLEDEIATGCAPKYKRNTGTACPDASVLWSTPQPWSCVKRDTGAPVNKIARGLNLRILGSETPSTCSSRNNWASYPNVASNDPRIVQVFLTNFGSFLGTGNGVVPVTGFATFYVTGWQGSGGNFVNPCIGQGDDPAPGDGYILGHFARYLQSMDTTSTEKCNPSVVGVCVAVMTE